jgi:hypothetical protein
LNIDRYGKNGKSLAVAQMMFVNKNLEDSH